ncbi:MAG: hypothetical protein EAZ07_01445 [Cytophagales bacterium]|nr:MAG: hypothetical protein EAZ07_01445 [Cytophagales bacterium]
MSFIGNQNKEITKDMMSYMSAVAHGKSARKVENRRKELLKTTKDAIRRIQTMAPFKGDKSLRDSTGKYLIKLNHILNDDYDKIVNMEEIAEQSYDAMEAYLTAQDMAHDKLDEAGKNLDIVEKQFAEKNGVKLIASKDELYKKTEKTSKVNAYHRVLYLIFFKSYKQEAYMLDAVNKKDINALEQNKAALEKTSTEGLSKIIPISAFNGDASLKTACKQMLEFYKMESTSKIQILSYFFLSEENFNKIKAEFDAKPANQRNKSDVDEFNKSLAVFNKSVQEFNQTNNLLNNNRTKLLNGWNNASSNFLDTHTPKYK